VPINTEPEPPADASPDTIDTSPLDPLVPADDDDSFNDPLLLSKLPPLMMDTSPPTPASERPPVI
jgi:hypothetical protein